MTFRANFQPTPTGAPILPRGLRILMGRLVNRWVANFIAHCEREAARFALRDLDDRELKDIGVYRSQISDAVSEIASERARLQQGRMPC